MAHMWRNMLLRKFASGVWSLHLDADEFLDLPEGMTCPDLAERLQQENVRAVWSVMLDLYPTTAEELPDMRHDAVIDLERRWQFDGRRHLRLRLGKAPKTLFGGVRARLMLKHDLNPKASWFDSHLAPRIGLPPPRYNALRKPVLFHWGEDAILHSAHGVNLRAPSKFLLPLRHFKFNGAIAELIQFAIESGSYSGGSAEYIAVETLLSRMTEAQDTFVGPSTVPYTGFEDFRRTGNADSFD